MAETETKPAEKKKAAPKKANPQAKKATPAPKPKALPHVPTDPIAARNADRQADVDKALASIDEKLAEDGTAAVHSSELDEANAMLRSLRNSEAFRYLIFAAWEGGRKA